LHRLGEFDIALGQPAGIEPFASAILTHLQTPLDSSANSAGQAMRPLPLLQKRGPDQT
jgi:hypothetical protein